VVHPGGADPVAILVLRAVRVRLLGLVDLLIGGGGRDVGALLVLGLGRVRIVRIVGRLLLCPGGARGKQRGENDRIEVVILVAPVKSAAKLATQRPDRTSPALPHLHAEGACDYVAACPAPR